MAALFLAFWALGLTVAPAGDVSFRLVYAAAVLVPVSAMIDHRVGPSLKKPLLALSLAPPTMGFFLPRNSETPTGMDVGCVIALKLTH